MKPHTLAVMFALMVVLVTADAVWIYYYILAGTRPNPRFAANATHRAWTAYSSALNIFGFLLGAYNTIVWFLYFRNVHQHRRGLSPARRPAVEKDQEPKSSVVLSFPELLRPRSRRAYTILNLGVLLPVAIILIVGPFVVPLVSMPLAQQWAWDHRCDTWPVEVVLIGRPQENVHSSAVFSFERQKAYTFDLYDGRSFVYRSQVADEQNSAFPPPELQNITYDLSTARVAGSCSFAGEQRDCLSANMTLDLDSASYLEFEIAANLGAGPQRYALRSVDHDWQYSNDAPSMILRDPRTGESVLRTVVTKRGDCAQLKVCANTRNEARMLVPIGLILIYQEKWASGTTCGPKKGS